MISICFSFLYGTYSCLGSLVNDLLTNFGYSPTDCSIIGAIFIVSGLVGAFVHGFLLDKYNKYLLALRVVCFGTLICGFFFRFTLPMESFNILAPNIAVLGFFILPIIPVGYGFCSELTFPVSEAMSNGIMGLFSQVMGTAVTSTATKIIEVSPISCVYLLCALMIIACLTSLLVKEDLRRINSSRESI